MVRAKLNIGCRYSTPVHERPLHPTLGQFKPQPSQTQAPVTPATEPEKRAGGGLTGHDAARRLEINTRQQGTAWVAQPLRGLRIAGLSLILGTGITSDVGTQPGCVCSAGIQRRSGAAAALSEAHGATAKPRASRHPVPCTVAPSSDATPSPAVERVGVTIAMAPVGVCVTVRPCGPGATATPFSTLSCSTSEKPTSSASLYTGVTCRQCLTSTTTRRSRPDGQDL